MGRPGQFTIKRLMIAIALCGVAFALGPRVALAVGVVAAWGFALLGCVSFVAARIARWTAPGPGRSLLRENIRTMAIVAFALDLGAWLLIGLAATVDYWTSLWPWRWPWAVIAACVAFAVAGVGVLLGSVAFLLALSALMARGEGFPWRWKALAWIVLASSFPFCVGLACGIAAAGMGLVFVIGYMTRSW